MLRALRISAACMIALAVVPLLCICCSEGQMHEQATNGIDQKVVDQASRNQWQIDSLGCLHWRTIAFADSLIAHHSLLGRSRSSFEHYFGAPNELRVRSADLEHDLVYFFSSVCKDGVLIGDGDKCYAVFVFRSDALVRKDYICE